MLCSVGLFDAGALLPSASNSGDGAQVLLVSSGAVGLGRLRLGLSKDVVGNPDNVVDRQVLPKP